MKILHQLDAMVPKDLLKSLGLFSCSYCQSDCSDKLESPTHSYPVINFDGDSPALRTDSWRDNVEALNWVSRRRNSRSEQPAMSLVNSSLAQQFVSPSRAQVLLQGAWKDIPANELAEICKQLAAGNNRFEVAVPGKAPYHVDLASSDGAVLVDAQMKEHPLIFYEEERPDDDVSWGDSEVWGSVPSMSRWVEEDDDTCFLLPVPVFKSEPKEEEVKKTKTSTAPQKKPKAKATPTKQKQESSRESTQQFPDTPQGLQQRYGPQSLRGKAPQFQLNTHATNPHAQACFAMLKKHEEQMCGEYAAFYHSYSHAALMYEVQAAVGSLFFRYHSNFAPLPRLIVPDFYEISNSTQLVQKFKEKFASGERDHDPAFRSVAISAMCSLCALGPECSPPVVFMAMGYSAGSYDMSYRAILENLLASIFVPKKQIQELAGRILKLCNRHGLDTSAFGGKECKSGKPGHMLQIFIHRDLVDQLVYASEPWGYVDKKRQPISTWLNSDSDMSWGQARIVAHPKLFMQPNKVRMFVVSADPEFNKNRGQFQKEMIEMLASVFEDPALAAKAAAGIYGGALPAWWANSK